MDCYAFRLLWNTAPDLFKPASTSGRSSLTLGPSVMGPSRAINLSYLSPEQHGPVAARQRRQGAGETGRNARRLKQLRDVDMDCYAFRLLWNTPTCSFKPVEF
jgi:hypothetical protein